MTDIGHPFGVGADGRVRAPSSRSEHVRDLIEQVLFTNPGERVNRPDFGSGLHGLVFEPNGEAIAAALRAGVEAALQRWLAGVIVVEAVQTEADDGTLRITVQYVEVPSRERHVVTLAKGVR